MLAYLLALVVGLGSLAIYLAAFFFPEIHRKNDFIWSGVGLFYALVLWIFAPRITGGLLLGHVASVALLVWFGWQTLSLRRQLTPEVQQTPIPSPELVKISIQEQVSKFSLQEKLGQIPAFVANVFSGVKGKVQQTVSKKPAAPPQKPVVEIIDHTTPVPEQPSETATLPDEAVTVPAPETGEPHPLTPSPQAGSGSEEVIAETETVSPESETEAKTETVPEAIPPNPPTPELVAQAQEETEQKPPIPVEEVAPDAVLAPPAEAPPEEFPPSPETER
ncbi:hypothetical protein H6G06_25255 [Anabaena sphaerica FACHB-251]|uniref:Ycf66 family protein n=1 Tax=Anabaena sphaerica FACHB-251 TaxID=2692883 RepID=A0A926WLC0_9NOST|nr:Ycf66 family protein [Anabaena sphaerica]MBD2296700.1 hypothetical protein [Anabaena sphaerica FACHB-251]